MGRLMENRKRERSKLLMVTSSPWVKTDPNLLVQTPVSVDSVTCLCQWHVYRILYTIGTRQMAHQLTRICESNRIGANRSKTCSAVARLHVCLVMLLLKQHRPEDKWPNMAPRLPVCNPCKGAKSCPSGLGAHIPMRPFISHYTLCIRQWH